MVLILIELGMNMEGISFQNKVTKWLYVHISNVSKVGTDIDNTVHDLSYICMPIVTPQIKWQIDARESTFLVSVRITFVNHNPCTTIPLNSLRQQQMP